MVGSMKGEGFNQLLSAFSELLETEKAQSNFLYSPEDDIVIPNRNHKLLSTTSYPSFFMGRGILKHSLRDRRKSFRASSVIDIPHPFTDVEQRQEINWNDYTVFDYK